MLESIKWIGTGCVILATICRVYDQHMADIILSLFGAGIWGYVAAVTKDKALLTVNCFIFTLLLFGIMK
jgi:ABC-type microcin C transport system permease subunit YejB